MKSLLHQQQVAVFVSDRQLLARRIVHGCWVQPQAYADGPALSAAVSALLALPAARSRGPRPWRSWRILSSQHLDHRFVTHAAPDLLVQHAKACARYDLHTVQAFHQVFRYWPTAADIRDRLVTHHSYVLAWAYRHLRRRHELRGRRHPLKTVGGRLWLAQQARRILGQQWAAHVDDGGAAWLFSRPSEPRAQGRRAREAHRA